MSRAFVRLLCATLRIKGPAPPDADAWRKPPAGLAAWARYEGAAVWLVRRLRELNLLERLPDALRQDLTMQAHAIEAKNLLADEEAALLFARLAAAGAPYVAIKGTARRAAAARYPYADARATSDVDVLLPEATARGLWDALCREGYAPNEEALRFAPRHHLPALLGPGKVGVELHTSSSSRVAAEVAWDRIQRRAETVQWRRLAVRVPAATDFLVGAIAHAATDRARGYRLRYFLDAAVILASDAAVEWPELGSRLDAGECGDPARARAWLGAAAAFAEAPPPPEARAFPLERLLAWRLMVHDTVPNQRLRHALLAEGARAEAGLALRTLGEEYAMLARLRRLVGAGASRGAYRIWSLGAS